MQKVHVDDVDLCSPDRIRTGATALRGRRPGPLDDGARTSDLQRYSTAANGYGAGVPGLEPRLTEPESVGLPITPYPIDARAPNKNSTRSRHARFWTRLVSEPS